MKCILTAKLIRDFKLDPTKRRVELVDQRVKGYYAEVRATSPGEATLYLRWKNLSGKTCHRKLGTTGSMDVATGRKSAAQLKLEIAAGRDPQAEANAAKAVMSWQSYMETIYLPHARAHLRSARNLESLNSKYLEPAIGQQPINKISLQTAQKLHRDMVEVHGHSPASADHLAKLLRQALNYAVRIEILESSSVSKIRLFNVDNREERIMSSKQLRNLMDRLDKDKNRTVCLAIKFLFFTGARVNEALHARWADIDRKTRTWTIQATNSKSKQRRSVPLSDAAMVVLDQLQSEGNSEWLFNSRRGGRMTTIAKVWARIRREAGLEGTLNGGLSLRLHDARHAAASAMVSSGQSLYTVQKILGHSDPSVTQRYAHLSTEALREAANSIGKYVEKALEQTDE
jgi:integrase